MTGVDMQSDAADRLRLIRSANIGPVTYRHLLSRFGSAAAAIEALPDLAARGGGRVPRLADPRKIAGEMARVHQLGAHYVFFDDPDYPFALAQMENAPPVMIVRGHVTRWQQPMLAMVGARNASAAACRFAQQLAHGLAQSGVTVVSGLARGIDTAAHRGALGSTIGVIASGIDVHYPPENRDLQEKIANDDLLIAEQPPGTEPLARHFPFRNRIIAGLAQATLVVEAAPRSGSLITARIANELGRDVLAVPGSPLDQRAQGCNLLIREGATLIQSVDDVLESLRPISAEMRQEMRLFDPGGVFAGTTPAATSVDADAVDRTTIVNLLSPVAVTIDEIVRQSGASASAVQLVLLELELGGRIDRHAGGKVSLCG